MKKSQVSTTAQGIAFARALETSKPDEVRVCNDPYARQFIQPALYWLFRLFAGRAARSSPGVLEFLAVRCRYIDDLLQNCLDEGVQQVVILGAGLDSRAYRFEALKQGRCIFEVDQPATQQAKLERLRRLFGTLPAQVTFVPVDFNTESLDKLLNSGYDPRLTSLFIWEGVVCYLQAEAVDETLAFIRRNSGPGSKVVFDYLYASALQADRQRGEVARMRRSARFTGEKLVFGIEEGSIVEFLTARGFHLDQERNPPGPGAGLLHRPEPGTGGSASLRHRLGHQ